MNWQDVLKSVIPIKTIGKQGLAYITLIVCVGVLASVVLEETKMAARW